MPKLYVGDLQNRPIRLKKMYIGNENNNPIKLKKIWIGDQNNYPRLIFSEGLPDGYLYDYSAIEKQYNQSIIPEIINSVDGKPHKIQRLYLPLVSSEIWGLGSCEGRPKSFNNANCQCGRGGTFRLPNPVNDATLLLVQRLSLQMTPGSDMFTNTCCFNPIGEYGYATDYYFYSSELIGSIIFRKINNHFQIDGQPVNAVEFVNNQLCIVWLYTEDNQIKYRIKSINGDLYNCSLEKKSNKQIQDVRVCDWAGGGVEALTGELYEFVIWPRALTLKEKIEAENFLFDKWK